MGVLYPMLNSKVCVSVLLVGMVVLALVPASFSADEIAFGKDSVLYVGGSGSGNYSTIGAAVDDAVAGDTVFVYDGVYAEAVVLDVSISLIGESKEGVTIDPPGESGASAMGIIIESGDVLVSSVSITDGVVGVAVNPSATSASEGISGISILDVDIDDMYTGVSGAYVNDFILSASSVAIDVDTIGGVVLINMSGLVLAGNSVSIPTDGENGSVMIAFCEDVDVVGNSFTGPFGLLLLDVVAMEVVNNNFIDCGEDCTYMKADGLRFSGNYYGAPRVLPKVIWKYPYLLSFGDFHISLGLRVDWSPASEPFDLPLVVMQTSMGTMVLELYPEQMPVTTGNFLDLVEIGFFDGLVFHRVIDEFVIQGGGYDEEGSHHESPFGEIPFESHPDVVHVDGAISMARTSDPDSATSQFFICDGRQKYLDDEWQLENNGVHGYAAFGRVVAGMDVLGSIASVETERKHMMDDWPVEEVVMEQVVLG